MVVEVQWLDRECLAPGQAMDGQETHHAHLALDHGDIIDAVCGTRNAERLPVGAGVEGYEGGYTEKSAHVGVACIDVRGGGTDYPCAVAPPPETGVRQHVAEPGEPIGRARVLDRAPHDGRIAEEDRPLDERDVERFPGGGIRLREQAILDRGPGHAHEGDRLPVVISD